MAELLENVINNILFIEYEQRNLLNHLSNLEIKRRETLFLLQDFSNDNCTKRAKQRLIERVENLQINVTKKSNENIQKKKRRCRYYNKGYCRNKIECEFQHVEKICQSFMLDKKCSDSECNDRHPKSCKYWLRDTKGCFRGTTCKYLHRENERGKLIKGVDNPTKFEKSLKEISRVNVAEKVREVEEHERESVEKVDSNVNVNVESDFCESCTDEDKCISCILRNVMNNESFQFSDDGNDESIESILQKAKSFEKEEDEDILLVIPGR